MNPIATAIAYGAANWGTDEKPLLLIAIVVAAIVLGGACALPSDSHNRRVVDQVRHLCSANLALSLLGLLRFCGRHRPVRSFAVPLTLIAGAVFGLLWRHCGGVVCVDRRRHTGVSGRPLLFATRSQGGRAPSGSIEAGLNRDGALYLFLRLSRWSRSLPSILMGMTKMPVWKFWITSQIGSLPGTWTCERGTELARMAARPTFSLRLFAAFAISACARGSCAPLGVAKTHQIYARWTKPRVDRNVNTLLVRDRGGWFRPI